MSVQNGTERIVSARIWIGNLHPSVTEGELIRLCQQHGQVRSVNYVWNKKFGPESGQPKGYAFVEMESNIAAEAVIKNSNGKIFKGRRLSVNYNQTSQQSSSALSSSYYKRDNLKRKVNDETSNLNNDTTSNKKTNIRDVDDKIRLIQDALSASK